MAVGDLYETKIFCVQGNQLAVNVNHFVTTAEAGTGVGPSTVALRFDNLVSAAMKALLSDRAQYYGVSARQLSVTQSVEYFNAGGQGPGVVAGGPIARQVSGIITKQSTLPGRANRGRMYVPFPGEDSEDDPDPKPNAAYVADLATLATALITPWTAISGLNSSTFKWVVKHAGVLTYVDIATTRQNQKWATQRRRGSYGQANALPF